MGVAVILVFFHPFFLVKFPMDEIFSFIENFVSNRINSFPQNGSDTKQVRFSLHYIMLIIISKYDF